MQGAGSIRISADPVVLAPLRDLLTIFKPVDLWFGVSFDLAGEGDWHALKDFVVFEFLVERWCHPSASRVLIVLHVIVRFLHRRTLQTVLDLTDQTLLKARHFVFLCDWLLLCVLCV